MSKNIDRAEIADNGAGRGGQEIKKPDLRDEGPVVCFLAERASVVGHEFVVVFLQLRLDLGFGVGERLVEIVRRRRPGKGVLGHFDDDFHLVAVLFLVDDDLAIEDAVKIVFELGAGLGDVFFGFFRDRGAVAAGVAQRHGLSLGHRGVEVGPTPLSAQHRIRRQTARRPLADRRAHRRHRHSGHQQE